jgi:hypothetical protein
MGQYKPYLDVSNQVGFIFIQVQVAVKMGTIFNILSKPSICYDILVTL